MFLWAKSAADIETPKKGNNRLSIKLSRFFFMFCRYGGIITPIYLSYSSQILLYISLELT